MIQKKIIRMNLDNKSYTLFWDDPEVYAPMNAHLYFSV